MEQYDPHAAPTVVPYNAYPEGAIGVYLLPNQPTMYLHKSHSSQDSSDHSSTYVSPASIHAFLPESSPSLAPHHGTSSSLSSFELLYNGILEMEPILPQPPEESFDAYTILIDTAALQHSPPVPPQYTPEYRTPSPIELSQEEPEPAPPPPSQPQPSASVQVAVLLPRNDTSDQYSSSNMNNAALQLIACEELRSNHPIPRNLLLPFLQKVPYDKKSKGLGSRDGPKAYKCLWSNCEHEPIKRRDHALDHIAAHVGSKPYKCSECDLRFLRKADRRRHVEQRSHTKSKHGNSKSISIEVGGSVQPSWLTFLRRWCLRRRLWKPPFVTVWLTFHRNRLLKSL